MTEDSQIAIARLEQKVEDLATRVERGFSEVKDITLNRLTSLETTKANRDEVEKLQAKVNNDIEKRVNDLEKTRISFRTKVTLVLWGIGLIFAVLIWHLTGYHI